MDNFNVDLSVRNKKVFGLILNKLKNSKMAAVVSAVGTGKSLLAMELISRNCDKNILYLAPTNALINDFKRNMARFGLLGENIDINNMKEIDAKLKEYYPNLKLRTYRWFHINQTENKLLDKEKYDYLITDEYHHTGAEKWYLSFNDFKSIHNDCKFLGLSATPQRMDNCKTIYCENDVVYNYSLAEAIVDGVYGDSFPEYISVYNEYREEIIKTMEDIEKKFADSEEKEKILEEYKEYIRNINKFEKIKSVFSQHIKRGDKVLYFCPRSRKKDTKAIEEIVEFSKKVFSDIDKDFSIYKTYCGYASSEKEEQDFISSSRDNLNILCAIDRYNEGTRPGDGLDALIMGRGTWSYQLFQQQLGRILKANSEGEKKTIVIDLVGNIYHYQILLDEIDRVIKEKTSRGEKLYKDISAKDLEKKFKMYDESLESKNFLDRVKKMVISMKTKDTLLEIKKNLKLLDKFCKRYNVWPSKNHIRLHLREQSEIDIELSLVEWISKIKSPKFRNKYKNLEIEEGKTLYQILDSYYVEYCIKQLPQTGKKREIMLTKIFKKYCEENNKFPLEIEVTENIINGKIKLDVLEWLFNIKIFTDDYIYPGLTDEYDNNIEETIKNLICKYFPKNQRTGLIDINWDGFNSKYGNKIITNIKELPNQELLGLTRPYFEKLFKEASIITKEDFYNGKSTKLIRQCFDDIEKDLGPWSSLISLNNGIEIKLNTIACNGDYEYLQEYLKNNNGVINFLIYPTLLELINEDKIPNINECYYFTWNTSNHKNKY